MEHNENTMKKIHDQLGPEFGTQEHQEKRRLEEKLNLIGMHTFVEYEGETWEVFDKNKEDLTVTLVQVKEQEEGGDMGTADIVSVKDVTIPKIAA